MSKILIEKNATEYYDVDGPIIACVGMMAAIAMFKLKTLVDGRSEWEFFPDPSPQFDYYHQGIYRNQRATSLAADQVESLPDLPDYVFSTLEIKDRLEPSINSFRASDYRCIAEFLEKQSDNECYAYAILKEDLYETHHGDGCYRYLNGAFFDKVDATNLVTEIDANSKFQAHFRTMNLVLKQEYIEVVDFNIELFDRFELSEVLKTLDQLFQINAANSSVEEQYAGIPHRLLDHYDGGISPSKEYIDAILEAAPSEFHVQAKKFADEK